MDFAVYGKVDAVAVCQSGWDRSIFLVSALAYHLTSPKDVPVAVDEVITIISLEWNLEPSREKRGKVCVFVRLERTQSSGVSRLSDLELDYVRKCMGFAINGFLHSNIWIF